MCSNKESSLLPSLLPSTTIDPCIDMVFNFHIFHHRPLTFLFLWFHLGGGGPFDEDGSFHSMYQNNNSWKNNQVILWSHFSISWCSWRHHFWSWALVCVQVLEVTLWAFKCEGEVVINFPPLDGWANKMSQSNFGVIFMVHNQLSSRYIIG